METHAPKAVFLSYASQDAEVARRIADALRTAGVEVWFDQSELRGGDEWDAKIRRQIKTCALFVPVISANTQKRAEGYFRREWNLATQRLLDMAPGKPFLLPVVIDGTREEEAVVAEEFLRVQWTRLTSDAALLAFVTRVKAVLQPEVPAAPPTLAGPQLRSPTDGGPGPGPKSCVTSRTTWLLLAGAALVVAMLAAALGWRFLLQSGPAPAEKSRPSLAILPFKDLSAQKDQEWFCDGMTEELINRLSNLRELKVSARTSVFYFKGTQQDVREIGRMLGVATVLEGSIQKVDAQIRARVQLVNAANGEQLWAEAYQREVKDVFALQEEIALAVVAKLKLTLLGEEKAALAKHQRVSPAAYESYLKGLSCWWNWSETGANNALRHFGRAIEIAPDYAAAHAGLALVYITGGGWFQTWRPRDVVPRGKQLAEKAIQLDPASAEAYVARGYARMNFDSDWAGAERDFKRAVELDPNSVLALDAFANLLMAPKRQSAEAIRLLRKALDLDPLSAGLHHDLGTVYWYTGDFGRVVPHYRKTLELDRNFHATRMMLGFSYERMGRTAEAAGEFKTLAELAPEVPYALAGVGCFHGMSGRREEARRVLAGLERIARDRYVTPWARAIVHIGLGEKSAALDWLEKAVEERDGYMWTLGFDHWYDTLRSEPRYQALVQRMAYPQ